MRRVAVAAVLLITICAAWPVQPTAQGSGPTLSTDLGAPRAAGERVRVIVQGRDSSLLSLRSRLRGLVRRDLGASLALDVTREQLAELQRDSSIAHISGDVPVVADLAITNHVTRASDVWESSPTLLGLATSAGNIGDGIGVAVVDSGIAPHSAIGNRVVARANFVSWEPDAAGDAFGHGTHVAGAIAGSATAGSRVAPQFGGGSAPGVHLVDVRVLGTRGNGLTSDVIAGIDWAVANRRTYNIRVITLALGHPVTEPTAIDPLGRAVARAVQAGVVVVASAGNYGLTSDGAPVLGGITSPGNSPFALTVGALDTMGTVDRRDDRVAEYSSRGPTRYDMAVKPDVVAPGTRLVSLSASRSYLATTYPQWHIAGSGTNAYMRLSGSSMATGVVAGGVALLLDAHPRMTPAQVKTAIQMGASFVEDAGLVGGGAGSVDFAATKKLADTGLGSSLLSGIDVLLGRSSGAAYTDTGLLIDRLYNQTGLELLGLLGLDDFLRGSAEPNVLTVLGLQNPLAQVPVNHLVWGEVAGWSSSYYLVWGSSIQSPSGQYLVWGSSQQADANYLVWGSAAVPPDAR